MDITKCTIDHLDQEMRMIAVKGIIRQGDKILLVQRNPEDTLGGMYEFPGGGVERDEDLIAALKRELFEELQFQEARDIKFFSCIDIKHLGLHLLFYTLYSGDSPILSEDHLTFMWIDSLPQDLKLTEETEQILQSLFSS